jgi:hypothetical protein
MLNLSSLLWVSLSCNHLGSRKDKTAPITSLQWKLPPRKGTAESAGQTTCQVAMTLTRMRPSLTMSELTTAYDHKNTLVTETVQYLHISLSLCPQFFLYLNLNQMSVWRRWVEMMFCLFSQRHVHAALIKSPFSDLHHYLSVYLRYWGVQTWHVQHRSLSLGSKTPATIQWKSNLVSHIVHMIWHYKVSRLKI